MFGQDTFDCRDSRLDNSRADVIDATTVVVRFLGGVLKQPGHKQQS